MAGPALLEAAGGEAGKAGAGTVGVRPGERRVRWMEVAGQDGV